MRSAVRAVVALAVGAASLLASGPTAGAQTGSIADTINRNPGFGEYVPVDPVRVLDTRDGTGGVTTRAEAGRRVEVPVTSPANVPDNAWAVAANITVIDPSADGYLTAVARGASFTTAGGQPLASNVNFVGGQTVANLAMVGVFDRQGISVEINSGTADLAVDVVGYVIGAGGERGSRLAGRSPQRIEDTRATSPIAADSFIDVTVPGLPAGATGVAVNVTATEGTEASFLSVYAAGTPTPNSSSVTVAAGVTRPNLVFSRVAPDGRLRIYNYAGDVDVVVDLVGVFTSGTDASLTGRIVARARPYRGFDSRVDGTRLPLGSGTPISVNFGGLDGEVGADVQAAIINVTATAGTQDSYLNVYPATGPRGAGATSTASVLNWRAGEVNPNLAIVTIGGTPQAADRYVGVYNYAGVVHFVLDEFAYVLA